MPERFAVPPLHRLWPGICGLLLVLGIALRFYHLDHKVYWIDEVNTTLRSLGYTTAEVQQTLLTGEPFTVADLQAFQQPSPDHGWDDTWDALRGAAEHTPLYFLLSRGWVEWFGSTVAVWRSVAAILSLFIFPALFWLCWELFQPMPPGVAGWRDETEGEMNGFPFGFVPPSNGLTGWLAIALVAVSPLHVLYAQEARPYSLLTLMTALSCASLLWARRSQRWLAWVVYGITVALGLYSQLLFGLVVIAHALYILLLEGGLTRTVRRFSLVMMGAIAAFSPWLGILLTNLATVQRKTASLREETPIGKLIDGWFRAVNQMTIDWELAGWNIVLVLGAIAATILLIRHAPRHAWLLLVLVGGGSFLGLALPDLVLGGERSLRVRYLFPTALCLHIAVAYSFSLAIPAKDPYKNKLHNFGVLERQSYATYFCKSAKTVWQRLGQGLLVGLLVVQLTSCIVTSQRALWWNKSRPSSSYYQPVATQLNQAPNPWVLTESKVSALLALSYWLRPDIPMQAIPSPDAIQRNADNHTLFLLNGSPETQIALRQQGYELTPLYPAIATQEVRLWHLQPPPKTDV